MKCPNCSSKLKKVNVGVFGAKNETLSYQCARCDYYEFDPVSSKNVIKELKGVILKKDSNGKIRAVKSKV